MSSSIFHFPGRPPRINTDRRAWWQKEQIIKTYRQLGWAEATGRRRISTPVEIHVQPIVKHLPAADAGACYEVVKAIVDGVVDAGLLPDDGPEFVKCIHLHATEIGDDDRLVIEFAEL